MNIAVIGGGITGLTAAYELLKQEHRVTVFEKEKTLGGLAGGFKQQNWEWTLEYFYHHFFTNDTALINLVNEFGIEKDLLTFRPVTAALVNRNRKDAASEKFFADRFPSLEKERSELPRRWIPACAGMTKQPIASSGARKILYEQQHPYYDYHTYQLDSPMNLLTFPLLSPVDKLRTAALLGFCKFNPFWQPLEKISAEQFFRSIGGRRAWDTLWGPLMAGKFGSYADHLPASWLWARFHKRTSSLGYFRGGFQIFIDALAKAIEKREGIIYTNTRVESITTVIPESRSHRDIRDLPDPQIRFRIKSGMTQKKSAIIFDKILITTPSSIAINLLSSLATGNSQLTTYNQQLATIPHLYAQTLVLETRDPILSDVYWLNIMDRSFPFIAVVAHTNMVDRKHYGSRHITYIGNYLPENHPFLKMNKHQLLKKFLPYLQKINPFLSDERQTMNYKLFTAPFAQPVHTLNYSKKAPKLETPVAGIYLANLDSIYPWDRGTNYAVELGIKAAQSVMQNA